MMKRQTIRKALWRGMAVVVMVLIANPIEAATLKTDSIVRGAHVTVADLFDGVQRHGDYVLAPAPAPGKMMTIQARDLKRVATTFGLNWRPETGLEQVVLRSDREELDRRDVVRLLQEYLREKGKKAQVDLVLPERLPSLAVSTGLRDRVVVEDISIDPSRQTFSARIAVPSGNSQRVETISGRAFSVIDVPVLRTGLRAGDIIGAADIELVTRRQAELSGDVVLDPARLIGMTPRRTAQAGQPLQAGEVEAPLMVRRGQAVTVSLRHGAIALSVQGRALQNGAAGDTVRIINPTSNQVIEGVVTGMQAVSVLPPAAALN